MGKNTSYAYALLYMDDICIVHHNAELCLWQVDKYFKMKPGSPSYPYFYLGAKLRRKRLLNGVLAWSMSSSKYIQVAVQNVKDYVNLTCPGQGLPKHASGPFLSGYTLELDMSAELNDKDASFYQSQISVLCWCIELGWIDIITKVFTLSSHLALPWQGQLDALFHLLAYLEKKHNAWIVYDPPYPDINLRVFKQCDWKQFYGEVKEAIPPNAPPPRVKDVNLHLFIDSDHASDKLTW
jgi:hypothetical protein